MQLIRERLSRAMSREAEVALVGALRDQYQPLVADARKEWTRLLEIPGAGDEAGGGELFLSAAGELLYFRVAPDRSSIEAGAVWNRNGGRNAYENFRSRVSEVVGSGSWTASPVISPRFQMLAEEAEPLTVSDSERDAAGALVQPQVRRVLQLISLSPGIALQQVAEGRPLHEVGAEVQTMDELGMLGREFEVFCRKTDQKISRVPSLSALDEAAQRGFKCFHCGRSISEEQIIQLLTVTPEGMRLARPNVWLALRLAAVLLQLGVDPARILWRHERDHAIVEVFVDHEGSLFMFQIHQDELTADGAFRFMARTRFFEPDRGFLVTPMKVREDARRVLHAEAPRLQVLDDLGSLEAELRRALDEAARRVVHDVLSQFQPLTRVPVARLIGEYFLGPVGPPAPEPVPEAAAPVPAPPPPPVPVLEEPAPAPVEEEPPQFLPETSLETLQHEEPETHEVEPEEPVHAVVDLEPTLPNLELAPLAEEIPEPLVEEPVLPEEPLIGDFAQEIIPGVVPLVGEDQEEALQDRMQRILDTLSARGVSGHGSEVRDLLAEVSELEECSAMLADSDGLVFLGELDTMEEPDLVAALHVDLLEGMRRHLADTDLGELESLLVDGRQSRLHVHPTVDGLTLLVHSGRPAGEHEEETGPSLPGEMALREAILKRALEGMGRLDGVRGNIISQREGLPIDFLLQDDSQADLLAAVLTQALVDCERTVERMGLAPLRQLLLRTPGTWYSVVPLGREGMLITLLEPGTSRDIWLSRLPREASMVASVLH